jgi:hypothetical protein
VNVNINGKTYKGIEKLPETKLEHLLQLAQVAIDNYSKHIKNYPPSRMEMFGYPHLAKLNSEKELIQSVLLSKTQSGTLTSDKL